MGKVSPASFRGTKRFELLRRLGQGGMGVVFAVHDRERGTTVALKTLSQMSADALLLFKNEFRALADIHHENLINLYELVEEQGQWFLTMDLVEGSDFVSYVRPRPEVPGSSAADDGLTLDMPPDSLPTSDGTSAPGSSKAPVSVSSEDPWDPLSGSSAASAQRPHAGRLDTARLHSALLQLGRGLSALHAKNKIHRDIKPHEVARRLSRQRAEDAGGLRTPCGWP